MQLFLKSFQRMPDLDLNVPGTSLFLKISIGFVWLLDQMTHKKWLVWLTIWLVGKVILRNLDFLFFFFFSCFLSSSPSRLVGVLLELGRLLTSTLVMKACPS